MVERQSWRYPPKPVDAQFDTLNRPLCWLRVGKTPSVEAFDSMFAGFEAELERNQAFCVLADASTTIRVDLAHAKRIAEFGERNHMRLQAYVQALALVVPSAMVRGALKVAFQIKAPPHPYKILRTLEEADEYLTAFLTMCPRPSP
jgi:hypothetical protein